MRKRSNCVASSLHRNLGLVAKNNLKFLFYSSFILHIDFVLQLRPDFTVLLLSFGLVCFSCTVSSRGHRSGRRTTKSSCRCNAPPPQPISKAPRPSTHPPRPRVNAAIIVFFLFFFFIFFPFVAHVLPKRGTLLFITAYIQAPHAGSRLDAGACWEIKK